MASSSSIPHSDPTSEVLHVPGSSARHGAWQRLRNSASTALVIVVLLGLAFWGHHSNWTLPSFAELTGKDAPSTVSWCKDHNVPENECIECRADLLPRPKDYGWCAEHGISQCPLHHPEVAQLKSIPKISDADFERARRALALRPRAENNSRCKLHERRVQFASIAAMQKVGVDIAVASEQRVLEAIVANGEVTYNQNHIAHLASRVAGTAWRVEKQVGDAVRKGDVLALIDAAEIGRAKADLLQAISQLRLKRSTVERLEPLASTGTVAGRQIKEAEAELQEANIRLLGTQQALANLGLPVDIKDFEEASTEEIAERIRGLGLSDELVASLGDELVTSNLFPLLSPLDGMVVSREIVAGELVDTNKTAFAVADLQRMWLVLDVRQDDARYLQLGQPVLFRSSDSKEEPEIKGSLAWISTEADEQTRTVKVRVDLPNRDLRLRSNTFGTGKIVLRDEPRAVVVPSDALHWDGDCNVVFVRDKNFFTPDAPKFFYVRKVRVGVKDSDFTEIIAGVLPGEVVASKNSAVLEAQLLKGNLGAGCCEAHTPKK